MNRHYLKHPAAPDPSTWDIAETVSTQDRAYFEQHPEASRYVRPAVAGELGPPLEIYQGAMVIVTQLRPGARHRRLIQPVQVGSS